MLTRERLSEILEHFSQCRIGVLGDVMLDEYLWGKVDRISPEAPVPVVQIKNESSRPGGAANVAANLVALGAKSFVFGVVGNDGIGRKLREDLEAERIHSGGLVVDPDRRTTVKTRIIGQNQQMIRIDRETVEPLKTTIHEALLDSIDGIFPALQGMIVSDYAKGVIVKDFLAKIIARFRAEKKFVNIDPKLKNFPFYRGATIITPNTREAESVLGRLFETEADVMKGGCDLLAEFGTDATLITRGEHGMSLFERNQAPITIPTRALKVFDVTGAGDTVIAAFSLAAAAGCPMPEAAEIANLAAGVVVGIVGTATVTREQILDHFDRLHYKD
jgi:rfaE bifunctional protein kinase chain/domain